MCCDPQSAVVGWFSTGAHALPCAIYMISSAFHDSVLCPHSTAIGQKKGEGSSSQLRPTRSSSAVRIGQCPNWSMSESAITFRTATSKTALALASAAHPQTPADPEGAGVSRERKAPPPSLVAFRRLGRNPGTTWRRRRRVVKPSGTPGSKRPTTRVNPPPCAAPSATSTKTPGTPCAAIRRQRHPTSRGDRASPFPRRKS